MFKTVYFLGLFLFGTKTGDAAASQASFYDQSPCTYSRSFNTDITDDAQCRTEIINDIRSSRGPFGMVNVADIPAHAGSALRLLTLITDSYLTLPETYQPCGPAELAQIVSNIDRDTRALVTPLLPDSKARALKETVECYHFRTPGAVYTSGFLDLLVPFVQMMDDSNPDLLLIYKSYHVLNSVARPGFSDFGDIIPKLWKDRITQYIGATGPVDRRFDHLLYQIILSAPPSQFLRLRMAQLVLVFGTRGALATYMVIAKRLWQTLGHDERTASPMIGRARIPVADVPDRVYALLEESIVQITSDILDKIANLDDELLARMGSIEPISEIEWIHFGVRHDQFGPNRRYSQYLWSKSVPTHIKSSFVPEIPTREKVYDALKKIQMFAENWASAPYQIKIDIDQVLRDMCRLKGSIAALPRTIDLAILGTVLKPDGVAQGTFDEFVRSLDDRVKRIILSHIPEHCDQETLRDPLSWFWVKLQLAITYAQNIEYVQTAQHFTGISLDLLNGQIKSFNDAVGIFSSIVSGIAMINEEFSLEKLISADKFLYRYIVPEVAMIDDVDSRMFLSGPLSSVVLPNLILGSAIDRRHPKHQYLFGHILSCGVTSNMAITIVLLRKALEDAVHSDPADVVSGTAQRLKQVISQLEFRPAGTGELDHTQQGDLADTAEAFFNSEGIRQEFFQTYLARIYDLYNLFLFRGTLDLVPEFDRRVETVVNNNLASLRVTDGNFLKIFTCGPTSYFRIRNGADCSETFSFNKDVGWDMVGRVGRDELILSRFYARKLCVVPSTWRLFEQPTGLEGALRDESSGWFGMTSSTRFLYVDDKDVSQHLLLDEQNSALDCIVPAFGSAPITQISCTFNLGSNQYIFNRKKREVCEQRWMTEPDGRSEKIRSVCPSLGANFIRLQQAAYEAKIDEFKKMPSIFEDQEYASAADNITSQKFEVGVVGAGGSHVRLCDVGGMDCEIWPLERPGIPDISTLNKVVSESLVGVNYVPNLYPREPFDSMRSPPNDVSFDVGKSGLSLVDNRAVLSCAFVSAEEIPLVIYRYWQIKPSSVSIEDPRGSMVGHCNSAWNMRRSFLAKLVQVVNRPMRYRSSTGFEENNQIMDYFPGRFEAHNVFVEYKRNGFSGFRVSIPDFCSIEFEVPNRAYPTSVWEFVSRGFHQVCQTPLTGPIPSDIFLVDIPASFCDSGSVFFRCQMTASSGDLIVVTQSSPVKSRSAFATSIKCRPDNISAYDRTKTDHCLRLGAQLIGRMSGAPSAPPIEP